LCPYKLQLVQNTPIIYTHPALWRDSWLVLRFSWKIYRKDQI
jgi:hypothetical protein